MAKSAFLAVAIIGVGFFAFPSITFGLEAEGVLVLYNQADPDGIAIADHYQSVHPGVTLLGLDMTGVSNSEQIGVDEYLNVIRPQVLSALDNSIDCIVTTKGLPVRIYNPGSGNWNTYSSLESELARIDMFDSAAWMGNQKWNQAPPAGNPYAINPYYRAAGEFDYDNMLANPVRLTSRLDGFTAQDVIASIDRSRWIVIDRRPLDIVVDDDDSVTYDNMEALAGILTADGAYHSYDRSSAFVGQSINPVIGYVSHGRNASAPPNYIIDQVGGLQFIVAPGAVFHTWESFNAYSFLEGGNRYGQGLIAEWIHRGGVAGVGNVEEPLAVSFNVTNEARMFEMLLAGRCWAEAAWNATAQVSYVNTVVGDPLMRWHRKADLLDGDVNLDGVVNTADLAEVLMHWGAQILPGEHVPADLNGDDLVNIIDLNSLLANWGKTAE